MLTCKISLNCELLLVYMNGFMQGNISNKIVIINSYKAKVCKLVFFSSQDLVLEFRACALT
jgi:hypothetical protein